MIVPWQKKPRTGPIDVGNRVPGVIVDEVGRGLRGRIVAIAAL